MPKTKFESVIFTAVTAWIMVYIMTLYNTVLATGIFVNETFLIALKGMWLEFVIIFLCAYFISSPVAKHFAFCVVKPGGSSHCDHSCHPDVYGCLSGGTGKHHGGLARIRLYQPIHP